MQQRYLMIEGIADTSGAPVVLVSDPERAAVRGFAGIERDPARDGEPEFRRKFRLCKHVRLASQDLLSAVAAGDLKQHGPLVVASSRDEAEKHIDAALKGASKPADKPSKGKEQSA